MSVVFSRHLVTIGDRVGPIRLWPHGFDLAVEWYGTRTEMHAGQPLPAQLNLGFFPGPDGRYFYSNPWPFDAALTRTPLPHGAVWHTDGWSGSMLPYAAVCDEPDASSKIAEYARAVFEVAAPTLTTP